MRARKNAISTWAAHGQDLQTEKVAAATASKANRSCSSSGHRIRHAPGGERDDFGTGGERVEGFTHRQERGVHNWPLLSSGARFSLVGSGTECRSTTSRLPEGMQSGGACQICVMPKEPTAATASHSDQVLTFSFGVSSFHILPPKQRRPRSVCSPTRAKVCQ